MIRRHTVQLFFIIAALLMALPVHAHHLWVERSGNDYQVVRGMLSERSDPYDTGCVKMVAAYASNGQPLAIERTDDQKQVRFTSPSPVAMAVVTSQWGYRVKTTQGKKFMTRAQAQDAGLNVLTAFFSTHCAKSLFGAVASIDRPVGLPFEFVPLENPGEVPEKTALRVKLLFDGNPLPGVAIFTENGQKSTTDENGIAEIQRPETGPWLIYSRHWIDATDRQDIDRLLFTTFLTVAW